MVIIDPNQWDDKPWGRPVVWVRGRLCFGLGHEQWRSDFGWTMDSCRYCRKLVPAWRTRGRVRVWTGDVSVWDRVEPHGANYQREDDAYMDEHYGPPKPPPDTPAQARMRSWRATRCDELGHVAIAGLSSCFWCGASIDADGQPPSHPQEGTLG